MNTKKILELTGEVSAVIAFFGILFFFLGLSTEKHFLLQISMVMFLALFILGTHYVYRTHRIMKEGKVSKWSYYTSLIMAAFALGLIVSYIVWL